MQRHRLMNRLLGTALVLAGVLGMLPGAPALAADQPALQAIDVQPLTGQQLQLTMRLSGPALTADVVHHRQPGTYLL